MERCSIRQNTNKPIDCLLTFIKISLDPISAFHKFGPAKLVVGQLSQSVGTLWKTMRQISLWPVSRLRKSRQTTFLLLPRGFTIIKYL